ncbi:olfactory receptor 14C36-like [Sphaerodactylus townsendi]|uniref:olfactory receptor 14C36-like n=1 Tax=Sphaerodactylus townsendi TaxID=933632 RepID=UPI002027089D|nr:olfactory receptor 14C36-like [Sphaerodactylus townsendi]
MVDSESNSDARVRLTEGRGNQTVTAFSLLGFSDLPELQILHFVTFLSIYSAALVGNFLLILTVVQNQSLHNPMYFFLANLSLSDACYISATVPKSMAISWTNNKLISLPGCVAQVFLVVTGAGVELTFLTVMAYDRYVAICHPLQYTVLMNWNTCIQMAAAPWISSIIYAAMNTANTFRLHFCISKIEQYFCDIPQLLMISCTDTTANAVVLVVEGAVICSFCFSGILTSYGFILQNVLKIKSAKARSKAFSTCIPHLTVLSLFLSTSMFSYMRPKSMSSAPVDLTAAVLYTILPPLLNPIIYSLKNKEIQVAMQKMLKKRSGFCLKIC